MDSKNKLQEIKSSDEKVINKKLLKDLYKNEKRLQCKIDTRDKRIKTLKEEMKTLKVENISLKLENENLEYTISHLNKLLDESHNEIALLKIDARLDTDNAANKIKDYESLKRESESKIIDLNLEIISKNEEIIELKENYDNQIIALQKKNNDLKLQLEEKNSSSDSNKQSKNSKSDHCKVCGKKFKKTDNFCTECGAKRIR